jgi:lysophospholipase L1-like esterase
MLELFIYAGALLSQSHGQVPHLLAIGDSTVAEYPNSQYPAVPTFLKGVTATTIAAPGHTIAQQRAAWLTVKDKAAFDIIVIQVGLNDLSPEKTLAQTTTELQELVALVNRGKRKTAMIAVARLNPAARRWVALYGERSGEVLAKWKGLNRSIAGYGRAPIRGVDVRIGAHVGKLSTPSRELKANFDPLGDGIHPSAAGRQIVACAWAGALRQSGFAVSC